MRFERNFQLDIDIEGTRVTVNPPLRIAFNAFKSIFGGLNKIKVQIYNLKESNRLKLVKDVEDNVRIPFALQVGYQNTLELLFSGTVFKAFTTRKGADFVTTLEGLDGGFDFLNSFTSKTIIGKENAIDAIIVDMPNTKKGFITSQEQVVRPIVLVGSSVSVLQDQLKNNETYYIDNETLNIIKQDDFPETFVPVVSPETGLMNTPERENKRVTFATLMNPAVKIGGKSKLLSTTARHLNGIYKIEDINYTGDYDGSDWKQEITGSLI